MPPIRTPLGTISGNQRDRAHLNPYQRGQIARKASEGAKPADIAADLNLTRSTIYYTFQQDKLRDNSISLL
jgi:IS30 family transposase